MLLAPVATTEDLANSPHHAARGFFQQVDDAAGRRLRLPGAFAAGVPHGFVAATPAPTPGQHNDAVYGGLLGVAAVELAALHAAGVL